MIEDVSQVAFAFATFSSPPLVNCVRQDQQRSEMLQTAQTRHRDSVEADHLARHVRTRFSSDCIFLPLGSSSYAKHCGRKDLSKHGDNDKLAAIQGLYRGESARRLKRFIVKYQWVDGSCRFWQLEQNQVPSARGNRARNLDGGFMQDSTLRAFIALQGGFSRSRPIKAKTQK
jgi:hypothetical protein